MIYGSQWFPKFINNCPFLFYSATILIFIFSGTQENVEDFGKSFQQYQFRLNNINVYYRFSYQNYYDRFS